MEELKTRNTLSINGSFVKIRPADTKIPETYMVWLDASISFYNPKDNSLVKTIYFHAENRWWDDKENATKKTIANFLNGHVTIDKVESAQIIKVIREDLTKKEKQPTIVIDAPAIAFLIPSREVVNIQINPEDSHYLELPPSITASTYKIPLKILIAAFGDYFSLPANSKGEIQSDVAPSINRLSIIKTSGTGYLTSDANTQMFERTVTATITFFNRHDTKQYKSVTIEAKSGKCDSDTKAMSVSTKNLLTGKVEIVEITNNLSEYLPFKPHKKVDEVIINTYDPYNWLLEILFGSFTYEIPDFVLEEVFPEPY